MIPRRFKKTISWNAFATLASSSVYYLATGCFNVVPFVVLMNFIVFPVAYYFHERFWERWP